MYHLMVGDILTIVAQFVIVVLLAMACEDFTVSIRKVMNKLEKLRMDSNEQKVSFFILILKLSGL